MENEHDEMANFSSAKSYCGKTKHVVLSIGSKLAILDLLKAGMTHKNIANEYRIGRSTVVDIKKNEEKIQLFPSTMESMA